MGQRADLGEQALMQFLPLHTGESGQHREREGNTSKLCNGHHSKDKGKGSVTGDC